MSHSTGSTKNTRNSARMRTGSGFGRPRRGRTDREVIGRGVVRAGGAEAGRLRVLVVIEEPRPGDEHARGDEPDQQQLDRDRGGGVDVVVLEGEVIGELVERVVPPG